MFDRKKNSRPEGITGSVLESVLESLVLEISEKPSENYTSNLESSNIAARGMRVSN